MHFIFLSFNNYLLIPYIEFLSVACKSGNSFISSMNKAINHTILAKFFFFLSNGIFIMCFCSNLFNFLGQYNYNQYYPILLQVMSSPTTRLRQSSQPSNLTRKSNINPSIYGLISFCRKTFWKVVKRKSTENYKGAPYITTLLSTSLWTFYGLLKPDILVVTVNGAGAIFQLTYVTLFLMYAPKDKKVIDVVYI